MTTYERIAQEFYVRTVQPAVLTPDEFVQKLAALLETVSVSNELSKDEHGHWKGCTLNTDHEDACVVIVKRAR